MENTHAGLALHSTISFPHTAMDHSPQPCDRNVQLLKTETLGSGSEAVKHVQPQVHVVKWGRGRGGGGGQLCSQVQTNPRLP